MCFIEKRNCIRIRKRKDCVSDPVHTFGRVGYWGASIPDILVVSEPRFRLFYKMIFEIFCTCIAFAYKG